MTLRRLISTADAKRRYVRALFAAIADRYDLVTVVLSYGRDRSWKRRLVDLGRFEPDTRSLDLATGTGDIAYLLRKRSVHVVGVDITPRMIELARAKGSGRDAPSFLVGDMTTLPFAASTFDVVTTGYGLRNVPDLTSALDEIHRVLTTGGQALSLDFNRPANGMVRAVYFSYLWVVGSLLGWLLHRDPDTYRYIPASLATHPDAETMTRLMRSRGFRTVTSYSVLGGLMAIHCAVK